MKFGFPPIAKENAKILILGTLPSEESLKHHQYYAHPRNAFWYIMSKLLKSELSLSYENRKALLEVNQIAVWDVLKAGERQGSLDAAIEDDSIVTNDFESFYTQFDLIQYVFFNGTKAEKEYKKRVLHQLSSRFLEYYRLPSSSPAMARLTKDEKCSAWGIILTKLLTSSDRLS
ncbi:MAG: DNA-deoxyinosine glycosylase [Candidatus Parabeggiatoa sp.]|nr:DNA-deoxyinosine glycosylase [Candidatus Parabeggiatoa sp.]